MDNSSENSSGNSSEHSSEHSSENSSTVVVTVVKTVLENSPHENRSTHFFVLCATTGHHPFGQSNARTQQPSTHDKFFFVVHHIHRDTQLPKHAQKITEQTSQNKRANKRVTSSISVDCVATYVLRRNAGGGTNLPCSFPRRRSMVAVFHSLLGTSPPNDLEIGTVGTE